MTIIAIHSPWPRCGKTAAASWLVTGGFTKLAFAAPLKGMVSSLLRSAGINEERIKAYVYGDHKEEVIPELGVTSRYLQQTLGTEWGRETIADDFWATLMHATLTHLSRMNPRGDIVIDDMRFPNEFDLVKRWGGVTVRLARDAAKPATPVKHKSEAGFDPTLFDYDVQNNGSLAELFAKMDSIVAQNCGKHLYH